MLFVGEPSDKESSVVVLQAKVKRGFEIDLLYVDASDKRYNDAKLHSTKGSFDRWQNEKERYSRDIASRSQKFNETFEGVFHLGGKYKEEMIDFAKSSLSGSLGSLGYFFGKDRGSTGQPKALFTAVPSRSVDAHGFQWYEGFHQILISHWDQALSMDVISHWFGTMQSDGSMSGELALGEAEKRSSDLGEKDLGGQRISSPPTMLMALERLLLLASGEEAKTMLKKWLEALWKYLRLWFEKFESSHRGEKGSYKWKRQTPSGKSPAKLNAVAPSAGLSDYPRASSITQAERHVDTHSWVAYGYGVLAKVSEFLGKDAESRNYTSWHTKSVELLDKLHWDDARKRYGDHGLHANKGDIVQHIIVKCCAKNHDDCVHNAISKQDYDFAKSQGGNHKRACRDGGRPNLREDSGPQKYQSVFEPDLKDQQPQFVDHVGYPSLFPFFLRLIGANSDKLGHALDVLEKDLWSDYGLRSLAESDAFYMHANGAHEARLQIASLAESDDAPSWRGAISLSCNYLAIEALRHYADAATGSKYASRAAKLLERLSQNVINNTYKRWKETGFLWQQYDPRDGKGMGSPHFNGLSSLVVLMMMP
jgi:mannosyl-oligosaccharide glucosidase